MSKRVVNGPNPPENDVVQQAYTYRTPETPKRTSPGPAPSGKPILGPGPNPSPRARNRF